MTDTSIDITIQDITRLERKFSDIDSLKEFLNGEIEYWNQKQTEIPRRNVLGELNHTLQQINGHFQAVLNRVKNNEATPLKEMINRFKADSNINLSFIFSENPATIPFLKALRISEECGRTFYSYLINRSNITLTSRDALRGALYAYEFIEKDETEIIKRRDAELQSFESLRKQLADKKDALIRETNQFQTELNEWKTEITRNTKQWQEGSKTEFENIKQDANSKIMELEKQYIEKLRLEGPAHYWNRAANKFRMQGIIWTSILSVAVVASVVLFYRMFLECAHLNIQTGFDISGVRGLIILMTIGSFSVFLICTFSKLAFSCFHLQRDAEEREQLVTLYLSLMHENKIDERSREIVLQALFSRSETGLLSKEHGPAMPSTNLQEMIHKQTTRGN